MPTFEVETTIDAPRERCFDLARDIDLHMRSMEGSAERAIGGRTSGLIGMDEEVTWQARHFGFTHEHLARITVFARPEHFRDSMMRGRFQRFEHDHFFEEKDGRTVMRDVVDFASPFGLLGRVVDRALLSRYLRDLIVQRGRVIKQAAEDERTRG